MISYIRGIRIEVGGIYTDLNLQICESDHVQQPPVDWCAVSRRRSDDMDGEKHLNGSSYASFLPENEMHNTESES